MKFKQNYIQQHAQRYYFQVSMKNLSLNFCVFSFDLTNYYFVIC